MYILDNGQVAKEEMWKNIENIRKEDVTNEQASVQKYWKKYVKDHINIALKEENSEYNQKFNQVYKRSILLFPLLTIKQQWSSSSSRSR